MVFGACGLDESSDLGVIDVACRRANGSHDLGEGGRFRFALQGEALFDEALGQVLRRNAEALCGGDELGHALPGKGRKLERWRGGHVAHSIAADVLGRGHAFRGLDVTQRRNGRGRMEGT